MLPDSHKEITPRQIQVLLGTLLGDANLHITRTCVNARFAVSHRELDKEYLFWKYQELASMGIFNEPKKVKWNHYKIGTIGYRFGSHCHPLLTELHREFYLDGRKIVSKKVLDRLDPLGLAVWFQDDGTSGLQTRSRKPFLRLSTRSFTLEENLVIQEWFHDTRGLHFTILSNKGTYLLSLTHWREAVRFLEEVRPYIVSCMERKLKCLEKKS